MKNRPLVSIILTYYKKSDFIKKALNSVKKQSYKNYEIILVYDDTDRSDLKLIKSLLHNFKNYKIILNAKNFGAAKSKNIGAKNSKGKFLAFLDADDFWASQKLEYQIKIMHNSDYDITYTEYYIVSENGTILNTRRVSKNMNYKKLLQNCEIGLSTVIAKRDLFKKFQFPLIKTQEDFGLWLMLFRHKVKFKEIDKTLSYWRKTKNSLSSNILQKLQDAFQVFYKFEKKNLISSIFSIIILSINKIVKN